MPSPTYYEVKKISRVNEFSDNNYSSTGAKDFTVEQTVFEIQQDTRYKIINPWVDISSFTSGATITFQFYRATGAGGAGYKKAGDTVTKVVGTDNDIVEFSDWAHYGYTKLTALSSSSLDTSVDVLFGYIKRNLE